MSMSLRRALSAGESGESAGPQKAPPLQLAEWLSGTPQNLGSGSHLVLNFVQEAIPRCSSQASTVAHSATQTCPAPRYAYGPQCESGQKAVLCCRL